MKCNICGSETPPHYKHHSLAAFICHTCKALGRVIEAAFSPDSVEPGEDAPEIEVPKPAEAVPVEHTAQEPVSNLVEPDPQTEQMVATQIEEPAPNSQVKQIVDQEQTASTEQATAQELRTTEASALPEGPKLEETTGKQKTKKLK